MRVEIRNDALGVSAFVAESRARHLGAGWYVVGAPDAPPVPPRPPIRPGIEVENPITVDAPQASSSPQGNTDTPEEKS